MVWQDVSPGSTAHIDAEQEREQRLAAQARAGAEWALAALVARYQPPVTRYLARLCGSPERATALAERVFVRMERRLRGPHGGENLRLWLLRASTEAGLDALRGPAPHTPGNAQLAGPRSPDRLLPGRPAASGRVRSGLDALAEMTGSTRRQVRQLVWSALPQQARRGFRSSPNDEPSAPADEASTGTPPLSAIDVAIDREDPRDALRFRIVRAVLSELPYGDAQCLALHLVAGLNQAEAARALGITPAAARRHIVQGLQLFAARYEAAVASLGLPKEFLAGAARPTPAPQPPIWSYPTMPPATPTMSTFFEEQPTVVVDGPPADARIGAVESNVGSATILRPNVEAVEPGELGEVSAEPQPVLERVVDAVPPDPLAVAPFDPDDEPLADESSLPARVIPVLTIPLAAVRIVPDELVERAAAPETLDTLEMLDTESPLDETPLDETPVDGAEPTPPVETAAEMPASQHLNAAEPAGSDAQQGDLTTLPARPPARLVPVLSPLATPFTMPPAETATSTAYANVDESAEVSGPVPAVLSVAARLIPVLTATDPALGAPVSESPEKTPVLAGDTYDDRLGEVLRA